MRIGVPFALVLALLLAPGCTWFRRAPKSPPAPPPSPDLMPATPKAQPPVLEPPANPPSTTPQEVPAAKPPLPESAKPLPEPPPAAKPAARPSRRRPAVPPAEIKKPDPAQTTPPVVTPAETPRLGEVLDPAQRQAVQKSYDDNRGQARQALDAIAKFTLTRDQQETLARARSFLQQAESLALSDLSTAARLARRASLLARDLLNGLR